MLKKINLFFTEDNEFFIYVLVIIGIYMAQTAFKVAKCRKDGTFDWKELLNGIIDYAIYFLGLIIFFFSGTLIPDKQIINFDGKSYTINALLTIFAYILMVAQATKMFRNIQETFNIEPEKQIEEVNDKNAYFGEQG